MTLGRQRDQRSTEALRRLVREGDRSALWRLVELNLAPLRRWAHRRLPLWARTIADTSDLVQDAIVRTVTRLGAIDVGERGALQAYLRQSVNNRIADELRRVGRRGVAAPLAEEAASELPSPLDSAIAADLEARYKLALTRMRERDRALIVGHVELQYTLEQLACMSGRTVSASRMALRRALVKLADEMAREQ
jgi:RNA polymerase sigma factor (sigma-70 family)